MSKAIDPVVIDKNGVSIAGQQLKGVTSWSVNNKASDGTFEVHLCLVTSSFRVDLDASPNLLPKAFPPRSLPPPDPRYCEPLKRTVGNQR